MPREWLPPEGEIRHLHLWPHRSLSRQGFVLFIAATAMLLLAPALAVLGSPVLWALLPFLLLAVLVIWLALRRNARDREIIEDLTLSPERIRLIRHGPRGRRREWEANPYWVRPVLHAAGGPVPQYLTLRGGPREVEIGAFLTPEERIELAGELSARLAELRQP